MTVDYGFTNWYVVLVLVLVILRYLHIKHLVMRAMGALVTHHCDIFSRSF